MRYLSAPVAWLTRDTPRLLFAVVAFVILLGTVSTLFQLQRLATTAEDGHLIDHAGSQRVLSVQVIERTLAVSLDLDGASAGLERAIADLDLSLATLRDGDEESGARAATGNQAAALDEMIAVWEPIAGQARVVASAPPESEQFQTAFSFVLGERQALNAAGERTVAAYEAGFDRGITRDQQIAVVIAITGGLLAIGALVYVRWLTQPLAQIVNAAQAVQQETGYLTRLEPRGPSDVQAVAVALNSMTETLGEREREVADANLQLQKLNDELSTANVGLTDQAVTLLRSNRDLEDFAYVASHDLQGPLRKIQAFGDRLRLRHSHALTVDGLDYLDRMEDAAARMAILVRDLLTLSRVTSQAAPFEQTDLERSVQEAISNLELRIAEQSATVSVGALPTIDCDPVQIVQLIQNLISNSLKFHAADRPCRIEIQAESDGSLCTIEVSDNGIGFDNGNAETIFGVFKRLHGRSEYEGTGIGLATCKRIVERHGGQIRASGESGVGATFTIALPLRQREEIAA